MDLVLHHGVIAENMQDVVSHRQNAMVEVDDDRPEVSLLFVVGCSTYLTLSKIVCDHES
jgi:hypothetical protein